MSALSRLLPALAGFCLLAVPVLAADWVEARISGFKSVKSSVGRIDEALSERNLAAAAAEARAVAAFGARIPALFPAGSGQGSATSASEDIWTRFGDFSAQAETFRRSAETLAAAAEAGDAEQAERALSGLRATCKSCHRHYKSLF